MAEPAHSRWWSPGGQKWGGYAAKAGYPSVVKQLPKHKEGIGKRVWGRVATVVMSLGRKQRVVRGKL